MNLHTVLDLGIALTYGWIFVVCLILAGNLWQTMTSLFRLTIVAFALVVCAGGLEHLSEVFEDESIEIVYSHAAILLVILSVAVPLPFLARRLHRYLLENQRLHSDLLYSETRFNAFLDSHPKLMAWIKDENLVNIYSNRRLLQTFGSLPLGKTDADWLPASTASPITTHDRHVLNTGQPYEGIELVSTPDGVKRSWLSYKFLLTVNGQRFVGGTATDITEQEQLRQEVEIAFRELEQFTYAASHDLKTPLRGISGLLALLERQLKDKLSGADRSILVQIRRDCDYALDLVTGILTYSKIGQAQTRRVPVDVSALIAAVCGRLTARLSGLQASIDWHSDLPLLSADPTQLQQIFENLIDNALKYRGTAPPIIKITLEHRSGFWVFAIKDNGIGIDPALRDQLFVMFARLHGRGEIEGTGIGLASVKKIAERHGGNAWIESEGLGCGSTVYFSLRSTP